MPKPIVEERIHLNINFKSYPFLSLSVDHAFPRLYYSRVNQSSKGQLFGPYPNAGSVRENLAMIH